jgi:hypothetical protein
MGLTPDQNKVFDAYDHMFASEGWQMFIEEVKRNQEALFPALLESATKVEELWFIKGKNDAYKWLLGLQALMDAVRQNMEEIDE